MTGPAPAGLHEVKRREWGGVIDEHFNHAPTLVAVIPRAYWTLVHSDGAMATAWTWFPEASRSTGMGLRSNRPPAPPELQSTL
jgi:hypothetical protein